MGGPYTITAHNVSTNTLTAVPRAGTWTVLRLSALTFEEDLQPPHNPDIPVAK